MRNDENWVFCWFGWMEGELVSEVGTVLGFSKRSRCVWIDSPDPRSLDTLGLSRKYIKRRRLAAVPCIKFGAEISSLNHIRRLHPSSFSTLHALIKESNSSSWKSASAIVFCSLNWKWSALRDRKVRAIYDLNGENKKGKTKQVDGRKGAVEDVAEPWLLYLDVSYRSRRRAVTLTFRRYLNNQCLPADFHSLFRSFLPFLPICEWAENRHAMMSLLMINN